MARLLEAVDQNPDMDILLAPELVMSEADADRLLSELASRNSPRLILAGTGLTREKNDLALPWNEARVLNAMGAELWRQQKNWPYGMSEDTANRLELPDRQSPGQLMEDSAAGSGLVVADIDSLGRIAVLICQDFQMEPAVSQLLRSYQPDWILVPILDTGVNAARWPHVRAFELSAASQARFMIVSSLTMVKWLKDPSADEPPIGLAVGPRQIASGSAANDDARRVAVVTCEGPSRPFGRIKWRSSSGWRTTNVSTD